MTSIETKTKLLDLSEHGLRVLSLRGRYVRRARYLRDHPPFRRDIERRRAEWDAAWPAFAIGRSPIPVHELTLSPGGVVPPKLAAANSALIDADNGKRAHDAAAEGETMRGFWAWEQLLAAICATWWPARYFPLTFYADHLAGRFVAGCLLCWPKYLPEDAEEWVGGATMQAFPVPAPVERMVSPVAMAELEGWGNALMGRLNEIAEARQVLTPELLAEIRQGVEEAARAAKDACRDELADPNQAHPLSRMGVHWVLPLIPGMTKVDLEAGANQVMKDLECYYGEHVLREDARSLARQGQSAREIAGLMGVSRSQVGIWINEPD